MEGTAALRGAAPLWSLAGDQQLLDLLQEIHQRIISKCNETNKKLEQMSKGLRDASVNLQNVNNKFLALSNTQFVESRVYDDDADVAPPAVEKEPPKPKDLASDLTKLKQSLQILESYHDSLVIVRDSDSDSDSDDNDDRLVLKPKDLYADRPLPYIIGSQAWKTKWHAGLVPDESDSDSSISKVEEVEQYSESEEERPQEHFIPDRTISSSTQSLQSEAPISVSPVRPSPAAVAAELARRLGGDITIPEREPVYTSENLPRKLYKPQEPLATTIFPDEPPPLEDQQSSDDDIFAELHKSQPKDHGSKVDDLFDFRTKPNVLEEALFGPSKVKTSQNIDKPILSEESESEIPETPKPVALPPEENVKKPVGGISLFGTNKHAESIGAAILKRNRRKSSTSGDESNTEEVQVKEPVKDKEVNKEKDIFDDLFAKSEIRNKKSIKSEVKPKDAAPIEVNKPKESKKKDIFSDIFDDIDDIFSSDIVNVKVKPTIKNDKSLFSDDDDLFAEVSTLKKDSGKDKVVSNEANLPGAIQKDNLLADVTNVEKSEVKKDNKVIKAVKEAKSIFDSDSDDGLFTNIAKDVKRNKNKKESPLDKKIKDKLFDDDDDELFAKTTSKPIIEARNTGKSAEQSKKALFDSDDELFKEPKNTNEVIPQTSRDSSVVANDDLLFVTPVDKVEKQLNKPDVINYNPQEVKFAAQPTVADSINNDIDVDIPPFESQKETTPEASHDSFDDEDNYTIESDANKTDFSQDSRIQSEDVSEKLSGETHFTENILRTTRIASDVENKPEKTAPRHIIKVSDDNLLGSKLKIPNNSVNTKQDELTRPTTIAPLTPDLFSSPADKNDVFSDVFDDVPPVFEKPKEPKRSKNVNALFDDDSDDEALFFKKNDVIADEKPDFNPSEERFGIFNDEPPAIDIDFTQKPNKKEEVVNAQKQEDDLPRVDKIDSLQAKTIQAETIDQSVEESDGALNPKALDTTDNTAKEAKKIGKLKPMNININVNSLLPGASPKKKQVDNIDVKQEHASNEELHKAEKIEPKMVKSISFDDPEILDNKISKERAKIQVKRRPSTRRARKEAARISAIDFTDSSFDSSNNNSTKDEVKEKIVKTVYILNDDDIFGTANTNKEIAESTKKHLNIVDSDEELFKKTEQKSNSDVIITNENISVEQAIAEKKSSTDSNEIFETPSNTNDEVDTAKNKNVFIKDETESIVNIGNTKRVTEVKNEPASKSEGIFLDSDDDDDDLFRSIKKPITVNTTTESNLDSDDELFRNAAKPKSNTNQVKGISLFSNSDDEDLFKTKKKETKPDSKHIEDEHLFQNEGLSTLGQVYSKAENIEEKHNIFDDFPQRSKDIHIEKEYKQNTIVKEVVNKPVKSKDKTKKSILDDLSDEDDLFKPKTKLMSKKDKSLFGDDDDDDDLFGTKPVKEIKPTIPVAVPAKQPKPSEPMPVKEPKAAEPVFVDPLSLFGDDDD